MRTGSTPSRLAPCRRIGPEAAGRFHAANRSLEPERRGDGARAAGQSTETRIIIDDADAARSKTSEPGGDMTYPLQSPGAADQYGGQRERFCGRYERLRQRAVHGLPSLSNGYIVEWPRNQRSADQSETAGLSTTWFLGSIPSPRSLSTLYPTRPIKGGTGASQVNYVTKSGTNQFHGNLYELWNGSRLNAADFFTNSTAGNHKPVPR